MSTSNYRWFSHKTCEYYPCHKIQGEMNCLFCYCPLYFLDCPGDFRILENGLKDCSGCLYPHEDEGWERIQKALSRQNGEGS